MLQGLRGNIKEGGKVGVVDPEEDNRQSHSSELHEDEVVKCR